MARERRSTPMPEAIPEPDPNEVSNRFDNTDIQEERAAALTPKKVHHRKHQPSSKPITSEQQQTASGKIDLKIIRPSLGLAASGEKVVVSDKAYSKDKDEIEDLTDFAELEEEKAEPAANDNDREPPVETANTQEKSKAASPRKRRPSSEPITSAKKKEVSGQIDLGSRRSSSDLITSSDSEEVSGEIRSKDEDIEDLTDLAVLDEAPKESSANDDDEPYAEMTITRDETPTEVPVAPRRKRAKRIEMSAQALADKLAADTAKEKEQRLAEMSARIDKALEEEDAKEAKEKEESWFKQGEDESYVKKLAEKQQIEDTQKAADVRRHIAETYDRKESETILATGDEVEATAKQAEAMLASGELSAEVFNVKDYRYLLIEKARLERELETAGWWQARKLRSELKETDKNLADYEQQITSVHSERATLRAAATKPAEGPWRGTRILPPGTGTTKKTSFFARLFGR